MDSISILTLQNIKGIGSTTIDRISSLTDASTPLNPKELLSIIEKVRAVYGRISIPTIHDVENAWLKASEILDVSQENGIHILSKDNEKYPLLLKLIPDSPALLHIKGNVEALNQNCIAVIGTRNANDYGISSAKKIGFDLAKKGYLIVSGLAEGIDSAAHRGSLEANGITVAVLAHGLDSVYPAINKQLAAEILDNNGTLVSEYPWGTKINRSYFVARNRIQSGLSLGVFVVETKIKSGTMHTVDFSEKYNRPLFVLDPPEDMTNDPLFSGNIQLISEKRGIAVNISSNLNSVTERVECIKNELELRFTNKCTYEGTHGDKKKRTIRNATLDFFT